MFDHPHTNAGNSIPDTTEGGNVNKEDGEGDQDDREQIKWDKKLFKNPFGIPIWLFYMDRLKPW